jgi:branched-chain amino acid transport system permease protein
MTTIESGELAPPASPSGPRGLVYRAARGGRGGLVLPLICALLLVVLPFVVTNQYWVQNGSLIAVLALVTSGVNLSFGYAGEVQFGQVFMFALGAYGTVLISQHTTTEIIPLLLIGGVIAAVVGAVVAIPALRFGGWSLALLSFFIVLLIPDLTYIFQNQTGGFNGLVDIPTPTVFGHALGTTGLFECCTVTLVIWLACLRNLVTSRYGVLFRSLRESEVLIASLGFRAFRLKLLAYSLGAFPAGVAGCLYAFVTLVLTPSAFGIGLAIAFVAASIVGGTESVYGAVIAAAVLQLGPQQSASFQQYSTVVYGVFLIVAAVAFRQGLSGLGKALVRRLAGRGSAAVPNVARHDVPPEFAPMPGVSVHIEDVVKRYGGVVALDGVSLDAHRGVVTGLIGANGSGKTTLINVVCGYIAATSGSVSLDGKPVPPNPAAASRMGIGRTFQTPVIPRGVSVHDVIASGHYRQDRSSIWSTMFRLLPYYRSLRADRRIAASLIQQLGLAEVADREAAELSLGLRRLVEVGRALASQPGLVLLDEPASGLSAAEVGQLAAVLRAVAAAGAAVVVIEHNFDFISRVSDTVHVLHFGRLLASGSAAEVAADTRVIESYLGGSGSGRAEGTVEDRAGALAPAAAGPAVSGPAVNGSAPSGSAPGTSGPDRAERPVVLDVRELTSGYGDLVALRDVDVQVREHQIEVILGRNGAGKTTLLRAVSGDLSCWGGSVRVQGAELARKPAYVRARNGIALVQEGKRIFRQRTVMQNLLIGTSARRSMSAAERRALCAEIIELFPSLKRRATLPAGGLSGGEQQMLAIGQALAAQPRVLLLDEPSAGLAPSIVEEVFGRLRDLCVERPLAIVLTEQLAEQALAIADHVSVMDAGQVVASGEPDRFADLAQLQAAYFGAAVLAPRDADG